MKREWLTPELKDKVKLLFEGKYKRPLSDDEIVSIATNLVNLTEAFLRSKPLQNKSTSVYNVNGTNNLRKGFFSGLP